MGRQSCELFTLKKPELVWIPDGTSSFVKNYTRIREYGRNVYHVKHYGPVWRYFTTIYIGQRCQHNSGYCVGLSLNNFTIAMKPWQCQVELDLLMLEYMVTIGKQTQVFIAPVADNLNYWYNTPQNWFKLSILNLEKPLQNYYPFRIDNWMSQVDEQMLFWAEE